MSFELPESYRAYCKDAAVRTAVDHISVRRLRRRPSPFPPTLNGRT